MRISTPAVGFVKYSDFVLTGDLLTKGAALVETLEAGLAGSYLQGKGAATLPAYEKTMPPLTTKGDIIVQGGVEPFRREVGAAGHVLFCPGGGDPPYWTALFNLLTTKGDMWVQGPLNHQRLAAGLLDTYFKGQGAGELPIYEKLALRDTGVKIGNNTRDTAGAQVITGVGFQPSVVIFVATDSEMSNINISIGFDTQSQHGVIRIYRDATLVGSLSTASISIERGLSDSIRGAISTLGGDGFTITWTLVGTAGTTFYYLALP